MSKIYAGFSRYDITPEEYMEMSGFGKEDVNTFAEPFKVAPRTYAALARPDMTWTFPAESFTILRFRRI